MSTIHAEIEYLTKDGINIHSDICPPDCYSGNLSDQAYREYLHDCLDEWLENSNGTGGFYIKEEKYRFEMYYGE
jgi:hypothetical protein